jgi:serine/threonine protein kinase
VLPVSQSWSAPRPLRELRPEDLQTVGAEFLHDGFIYSTTGRRLGQGGMGNCYLVQRRRAELPAGESESCVAKAFHSEYLYQLRTDDITRRDHEAVIHNMEAIRSIEHPSLLSTYVSLSIGENHLTITPEKECTLKHLVSTQDVEPVRRVELLLQALRALSCLHRARLVHRDFTLRNILVANGQAYLFDFDLALSLADVEGVTYKAHYQGRIFGSPGFSVAPEILDPILMESRISPRLDIYAAGGAIFALFTEELPYGETEDMWSLLLRISDGVVVDGKSRIAYPATVPSCLRPIIERCMERNPERRYPSASELCAQLEARLPELGTRPVAGTGKMRACETLRYGNADSRLKAVFLERRDPSIARSLIEEVDHALSREGYELRRAAGRIRDHAIFMAAPDPTLVAQGKFPDANTYPKLVTVIELAPEQRGDELLELWLGKYASRLTRARQGLLTPLYRVSWDATAGFLLLFSEYVEGARFGTELDKHDLTLEEVLALGYLITGQVGQLHEQGLAHNNVCAASLLFKASQEHRRVHPAMVGLVSPSLDPADRVDDVRRLAALISSWIRPARVEQAEEAQRVQLELLRSRLAELAFGGSEPAELRFLLEALADGISALDGNFGVLRAHGGDLEAYTLLLISHSLFGRLWRE